MRTLTNAATLVSASGKRMSPRVQMSLTVVLDGRKFKTRDLSLGGFGLAETGPLVPVGTTSEAALQFPFAGFTTVLNVSARVIHPENGGARGFEFTNLSSEQAHMIEMIIRKRLAGELIYLANITEATSRSPIALRVGTDVTRRRRFPALRTAAMLLASFALFVGAATFVGSRLLTVTSDYAAVAGMLRQVRAPEAGYLEESTLAVGARVRAGQVLAHVRPAVSPQAQVQIASQLAVLRAMLDQQQQAATIARSGFENFLHVAQTDYEAAAAQRKLIEAQTSASQRIWQRASTLATTGVQSQETVDTRVSDLLQKQQALTAARDAELTAQQKLEDAQRGLFVSDGRSTQKSPADLDRDIAGTRAQIDRLEALNRTLDQPLSIHSPCDCIVAALNAMPNVFVAPGDQIADLAESGAAGGTQIDALIPNQRLTLVRVGQPVEVYLASHTKSEHGLVTAVKFNPTNNGRVGLPDVLRSSDLYGLLTVTLDGHEDEAEPGTPAIVMAPIDRHILLNNIPALAWTQSLLDAVVSTGQALIGNLIASNPADLRPAIWIGGSV